jgi:hypothetical protein
VIPSRSHIRTCSSRCGGLLSRKKVTKKCKICGKEFDVPKIFLCSELYILMCECGTLL